MMSEKDMILYDRVVDLGIATPEEINLVFNCSTWRDWEECLNAIIYSRTGFRSIEQMQEAEDED